MYLNNKKTQSDLQLRVFYQSKRGIYSKKEYLLIFIITMAIESFSFDYKETQKSYVLYTSSKLDEFGKLIIQAGKYEVINEDTIKVDRNLTQEEFEMISQIMKEMINLANKNDEEEDTAETFGFVVAPDKLEELLTFGTLYENPDLVEEGEEALEPDHEAIVNFLNTLLPSEDKEEIEDKEEEKEEAKEEELEEVEVEPEKEGEEEEE